ncbi:ATP-dependent DNA/RNA helicase DHX36-like isoform X1 [Penaeus monodon]|uniref:ATP-dependent DNA/RNA helicase DHX36-like isoform X1 n=1 Tax=Penaeus monodon TaxID=6687 RepID=UPI0018A7CAE9|nr:ATP-dependent DNA/RNA helicase DHX36-like isoform X1 [Penaeus monodon]
MYGRREGRGGYRDGGGDGGGWRGESGGGWGGGRGRGRGGGGGRGRGGGGGGRGRGERPPPHLKGREIGMWYAQRSKDRQEKDVNLLPTLSMDASQVRNVGRMLDSLDEKDYSSRGTKRPEHRAGASYQPEPDDDLSDEWDKRISSIVKKEFKDDDNTDVAGSSSGGADSFSDPDAWIQDNTQKRKISAGQEQEKRQRSDAFAQRLDNMKESDFKQAYMANVHGNQMRDASGLSALKRDQMGLVRKEAVDEKLYEDMMQQQNCPKYQKMLEVRKKLPSYKMRDEIVDTVRDNQVVVISGETGCGKTTQVAQFLLEDAVADGQGSTCSIVCTQPRRISAISVAQRVADERGENLGKSVGYQIRLEATHPRSEGSILFCTTGIVLQWLQSDPLLSKVSHLVLDEIHERDMLSDFIIAIAKDLIKVRSDLKVILMSATLNAELFSEYFGGCPMLHIPGFTFPVKEFYLEDVIEMTRFKFEDEREAPIWVRKSNKHKDNEFEGMIAPYIRNLERSGKYSCHTLDELYKTTSEKLNLDLVLELLRAISRKEPGAVLVFLPGWADISKLHTLIQGDRSFSRSSHLVIPLHSLMPSVNQREVFSRPPPGVRKIVLATNIAETSITIDDIVYVINAGRIKMKNYDKEANLVTLLPEWVTLANARQRRGRAGRVQDGVCYHLYTRAREKLLDDYPLPEIQRTRLEEIILHVKILRLGSAKPFLAKLMMPPDPSVVDKSLEMLQAINALDESENLTPLGFHLARLPVDPLTGRMLLMAAIFSCVGPILTIASALSFKDPFSVPLGKERIVDEIKKKMSRGTKSDHLMLVNVYDGWEDAWRHREAREYCWDNFLSSAVLEQLRNMRRQFMGLLYEHKFVNSKDPQAAEANRNSDNIALVRAIITSGLYPNVARVLPQRGRPNPHKPRSIRTQYERRVSLHPKSVNEKEREYESPWLMYREKIKSSKVYIHDSSMVPNYPLLFFGRKLNYVDGVINVDDFVRVRCSRHVAHLVQSLRTQLDELLEYKISHPGVTRWNKSSKEGALLHTIVDLISSEKISSSQDNNDYYDDGDD